MKTLLPVHLIAFKAALAVSLELMEAEVNRLVEVWEPVEIHYQPFEPTQDAPMGYLVVGVKLEPVGLEPNGVTGNYSEEHGLWAIRMMVYSDGTGKIE